MPRSARVLRHHRQHDAGNPPAQRQGQLELPDTGDGYISAVICRRPDGSVGWQAPPPEGDGDAWVTVFLEGDAVVANSWSWWRVLYDMTTGTETARHFTN
jgi:hypothetical protein